MVGPKKQDFWPRVNINQREKNPSMNEVHPKLGMILQKISSKIETRK